MRTNNDPLDRTRYTTKGSITFASVYEAHAFDWISDRFPDAEVMGRGWPDFLIMDHSNSEVHAVEVKGPNDRLSEDQRRVHHILEEAGIPVITLHINLKGDPIAAERVGPIGLGSYPPPYFPDDGENLYKCNNCALQALEEDS